MPSTIELLGKDADSLLKYTCTTIPKESLHLPGPDVVNRIYAPSDRNPRVLNNLQRLIGHGRLAGTGYMSILPVDQGIEHSAGASFAPNPEYFDPENIVKLAIEGGCNAVASTFGVLGIVARKYAHKIPFIVKINHNELLTYPEQVRPGDVRHGRRGVRHGRRRRRRDDLLRLGRSDAADRRSRHRLRIAPTSWAWRPFSGATCATTPSRPTRTTTSRPTSPARPTTSASRSRPTSSSRNCPRTTAATTRSSSAKLRRSCIRKLTTDHPIDLCRYQVANCYMGRCGLINSGGASSGAGDLAEAVRTAVINKRAGGMGLISGRKAFQRPMNEGVELLNAIQDVYLDPKITVA